MEEKIYREMRQIRVEQKVQLIEIMKMFEIIFKNFSSTSHSLGKLGDIEFRLDKNGFSIKKSGHLNGLRISNFPLFGYENSLFSILKLRKQIFEHISEEKKIIFDKFFNKIDLLKDVQVKYAWVSSEKQLEFEKERFNNIKIFKEHIKNQFMNELIIDSLGER
jgi:hypothetical protein